MSGSLLYMVTATFPNAESARGYNKFAGNVVSQVVGAGMSMGAISGRVVALDGVQGDPRVRIQTHYVFNDRAAFDAYNSSPLATRLKDQGRELFGSKGINIERMFGQIVDETLPVR